MTQHVASHHRISGNMDLHKSPRRLVSPILTDIPWYTTILAEYENLTQLGEIFPPFQGFIQNLHSYESSLFNYGSSSESIMQMQDLLGIALQFNGPGVESNVTRKSPHTRRTNVAEWTRLCGLVSAYRLLDVVALLEGETPRAAAVTKSPLDLKKPLHAMDKLANWPALLAQFRKVVEMPEVRTSRAEEVATGGAPIRILRMIARNRSISKYAAIEGNFLHAAMHLACLKELNFSRETFPDIPEQFDELLNAIMNRDGQQTNHQITSAEREDMDEFFTLATAVSQQGGDSENLSALRTPLQLALFISPICLMFPFQIIKKSFNRQAVISTAISLGNRKPQVVLEVERCIWKALFALVAGGQDSCNALRQLSGSLPWNHLENAVISDEERSWFHLDCHLPITATIQTPPVSARGLVRKTAPMQNYTESSLAACINSALNSPLPPIPSKSTPYPHEPSVSTFEQQPPFTHKAGEHVPEFIMPSTEQEGDDLNLLPGIVDPMQVDGENPFSDSACPATLAMEVPVTFDSTTIVAPKDTVGARQWSVDKTMPSDHNGDGTCDEQENGEEDQETDGDNMVVGGVPSLSAAMAPSTTRSSSRLKANVSSKGPPSASVSLSTRRSHPSKRRHLPISSSESESGGGDLLPKGHSMVNPIDVDVCCSMWEPAPVKEFLEAEEISLRRDQVPKKITCDTELRAFDAAGIEHTFTPEFHYDDYNTRLKQFFNGIEAGYNNGLPLHLVDKERSVFATLPYSTFCEMSQVELFALLQRKNLIVTDTPFPDEVEFDEHGLRTLSALDSQVSIQDFSVSHSSQRSGHRPVTVTGLVSDILENAQKADGKILNGLEFPMWDVNIKSRSTFAVDVAAWDYMRGKPYCGNLTLPYPTEHTSWGLAGTSNTFTFMHIDSDGFNSFLQVLCGLKVWVVYREKSELPRSSAKVFLDKNFRLDEYKEHAAYDLEAIVLRPGDLLFMQPNTPHAVYGPANTIVHGGHYYTTCLMQTTLQGIIHCFVVGDFITNITHHPSRQLLRRIVLFYHQGLVKRRIKITDQEFQHLPNILSFGGILDLLSACTLAILGNVLDFRTYSAPNQLEDEQISTKQSRRMAKYDHNDVPINERQAICYTRGVAISIFHWVRLNCIIKTSNGDILEDLPSRYIVQVLNTLIAYKASAMQSHLKGAPHCDTASLRSQVFNVVKCDGYVERMWQKRDSICADSLEFRPRDVYTVEWKNSDVLVDAHPGVGFDYRGLGITPFDRKFLDGAQCRSDLEKANIESESDDGHPLKRSRKL